VSPPGGRHWVVTPILGGWLTVEVSVASVFVGGGAFAVAVALAFLTVLLPDHGGPGVVSQRDSSRAR